MRYRLTVAAFLLMFLCGCAQIQAALDSFFGVGKGERKPSVVETIVETALNGLFPGSGAALASVGGLWAAYRGQRHKKAAKVYHDVVETHGDEILKTELNAAHNVKGTAPIVKSYKTKPTAKPVASPAPIPPASLPSP